MSDECSERRDAHDEGLRGQHGEVDDLDEQGECDGIDAERCEVDRPESSQIAPPSTADPEHEPPLQNIRFKNSCDVRQEENDQVVDVRADSELESSKHRERESRVHDADEGEASDLVVKESDDSLTTPWPFWNTHRASWNSCDTSHVDSLRMRHLRQKPTRWRTT